MRKEVFTTMLTPYKNGEVDYEVVEKLVKWYWSEGCDGIFASCLSGEIFCLDLSDRVRLVREVIRTCRELAETDKSRAPMKVVASGHISDSFEDQVAELTAIAAEGPDALILISNRMDIENTSDDQWIADAERLCAALPKEIPLGIYECPVPYTRPLTEPILRWCASNPRFVYVKDICSNLELIQKRLSWCEGSNLKLYNANSQTLLDSVEMGAAGFCGIMGNVHPYFHAKLLHGELSSEEAKDLQVYISALTSMVERTTYPACAKYFLATHEGIPVETYCRSIDNDDFTDYNKYVVDQMAKLTDYVRETVLSSGSN